MGSSDLTGMIKADQKWLDKIKSKLEDGTITGDQWTKVQQFFLENQFGPVQPSIICKGESCPYIKACPLAREKVPLPFNDPCPIEETAKSVWFQQLAKELGSLDDGFDATDLGAACDIINLMVQKQRVQWELVKNPEVATRTIVGMTPQGEPIVDLKANPSFFALKALLQMQQKISDGLMTTREARSKDQSRKTQDAAVQYAAMAEVIERTKQIQSRDAEGRPITAFDAIAMLPSMQTSDDRLNKDVDEDDEDEALTDEEYFKEEGDE
jgi:hypothetical protein